jgi:hypothetical protein
VVGGEGERQRLGAAARVDVPDDVPRERACRRLGVGHRHRPADQAQRGRVVVAVADVHHLAERDAPRLGDRAHRHSLVDARAREVDEDVVRHRRRQGGGDLEPGCGSASTLGASACVRIHCPRTTGPTSDANGRGAKVSPSSSAWRLARGVSRSAA